MPEPKSLLDVEQIIAQRANENNLDSYVQSLLLKGTDAILKKIGEESAEVLIASKNNHSHELIHELTDLWFHCLVLMNKHQVTLADVEQEFGRRFGRSGLEEKRQRSLK